MTDNKSFLSKLFGSKKSKGKNRTPRVKKANEVGSKNEVLDIKDCINFANENPVSFFATTENDQPRVRALGFWFADETGFYFQSSTVKELVSQLENNKKVEVCFYKHEGMIGTMLRIAGMIEFINDIKLKEKVLEERPFLKSFGLTVHNPSLVIFRIPHGKAHFWNMKDNLKPKEYIEF